jgi:succinoglycan biosynthesis transport protein ExoP
MDLFDHFRVIARHRSSVLIASLVVSAVAFGWSYTRPSVYEATALISVTSGRAVSGQSFTEQDTLFLARNYAELAGTRPVLTDAVARSRLPLSAAGARGRVSSRASSDVGFITLAVTGPSPEEATRLAQGTAEALIAAVADEQAKALRAALGPIEGEIFQVGGELAQLPAEAGNREALVARYQALVQAATERRLAPTDRLVLVSPPRGDSAPVSPTPVRDSLLALLVALVVNSELAVLLEVLRDRMSSTEGDEGSGEIMGLPVLASIPQGEGEETQEAFRTLRTSLMFLETRGPLRTVAVLSANPSAGKTFTCQNLARSVASLGLRTVVADGDLRRPSVHRDAGIPVAPGLSDVLQGQPLSAAVHRDPHQGELRLLPGGSEVADPAGLVAGRMFRDVLDRLEGGLVIVDTPACDLFADGFAIASHCDAALVVVDAKRTRRRALRRLISQLHRVGANPIGIVLNRVDVRASSNYYNYYYGQGRKAVDSPRKRRAPAGSLR